MMKNNVSHADKLLKLIFLDKLDAGSGKSKIQKFISMIIEREYFMKILAKLVKNALKTGFFWISRKSGSKIQNSFLLTNKHADR